MKNHLTNIDALAEAEQIALTGEPSHEIWEGRWLYTFNAPSLFVVAPHGASITALAILIVEQAAIHRAQQTTDWASRALEGIALRDLPTQGGEQ